MEELVKYIVEQLVDDKDSIIVSSNDEDAKTMIITVNVAKDDVGKIIGRNGKIASSIRTIVKSASVKLGKRVIVKIGERD